MKINKKIILDLQIICKNINFIPSKLLFNSWLKEITSSINCTIEITVRIVNKKEIQSLNKTFCNKDNCTNILSFPFQGPLILNPPLLGDLIICPQILEYEAKQQQKLIEHHWAHIIIHGTLHLLGYDHIIQKESEEMEKIEIRKMRNLGYPNPYL